MKIILILLIVAAGFLISNRIGLWQDVLNFFNHGDYRHISLDNLLSYSNFSDGDLVCTEGFHIKEDSYNVLKPNPNVGDITRSAWILYEDGKEQVFDSLIPKGDYAKVAVCGKFESGRDSGFGNPPIWNQQITINKYELLEKPRPVTN